ncbi:serine/threonine-protein kinase [Agilicoccus flavus]|uniref:serine/threonine-protein kinase n=1 Tax=Agilicoccus flavus TaxID=2775968 RepID=UPI001CF6B392|nr:serine/threonine-protein kinase [Agilicoccus flavus]
MRCNQTGCPGTYVDGYCDFCGFPQPQGEANTSGVPTATAASTAAARTSGGAPAGTTSPPPPPAAGTTGNGGTDGWAAAGRMPDERAAVVVPHPPSGRASRSIALGSARGGVARRSPTRRRTRRVGLGAGLARVPSAPPVAPDDAVMHDAVVPESKRNCPSCGAEVGRSRDGGPGRTEGYCPKCRNPYSFTPKLRKGDLVAGQYEVVGPLAHGGLGWVYLALDRNVSDRPVVLKGLLNSGDSDALGAAVAEQEFLARVEHPLIVEVYNVVTHAGAGYTVMEYVGGRSLKELLKDRMAAAGGVYDPLPVDHALAFVLEILPAFAYLHDVGLLYCDFKPDNLIQVGDQVKLIDLGGVRRIDDLDSPIYGTVGYQAPEVAEAGPSVASDVYTIGRTLVVLTTEFRGYQSRYATTLPPIDEVPAFRASRAFYQLVAKACAADPADRFQSIEELRVQLLGVLRTVVLDRPGAAPATQPWVSPHFEAPFVADENLGWWQLPALRPDESDPMIGRLQSVHDSDPEARIAHLERIPERTAEVLLELCRADLRTESAHRTPGYCDELLTADPWDWRALWMLGLHALRDDDLDTARASFDGVAAQVPGELAPVLARALTDEIADPDGRGAFADHALAAYSTCLRTDAAYATPAAFGVMRVLARRQDHTGAAAALDAVPPASAAHSRAEWLRAELLARGGRTGGDLVAYDEALRAVRGLDGDPRARADFRVRVLSLALTEVERDRRDRGGLRIDGVPATRTALRRALEGAYLDLASHTRDDAQRWALVDHAHEIRPWSLI